MSLGFVPFWMLAEEQRQADGLETQVLPHDASGSAAVVALVEQKVDRLIDRFESFGYVRRAGHLLEPPRKPEELTSAAQPFFDSILAGQEGVGDFGHAESAQ